MPSPRFDSASGHAAAKRSGAARKRLDLARVERELGELETLVDAQRWLRQLALWGVAGLIPGSVLGACVRAVDQWIRCHESKLTEAVTDELRTRLDELEAGLKQGRLGVVR